MIVTSSNKILLIRFKGKAIDRPTQSVWRDPHLFFIIPYKYPTIICVTKRYQIVHIRWKLDALNAKSVATQPILEGVSASIFLHFADVPYHYLWLLHWAVSCRQIRAILAIGEALPGPPLIVFEELFLSTCLNAIYHYKSSRNICEIAIDGIDSQRRMRLDATIYYMRASTGPSLRHTYYPLDC